MADLAKINTIKLAAIAELKLSDLQGLLSRYPFPLSGRCKHPGRGAARQYTVEDIVMVALTADLKKTVHFSWPRSIYLVGEIMRSLKASNRGMFERGVPDFHYVDVGFQDYSQVVVSNPTDPYETPMHLRHGITTTLRFDVSPAMRRVQKALTRGESDV